MSHFAVAVLTREGQEVDDLLAPYMENCCAQPDYKYMEFYDGIEMHAEEYARESTERVKMPDGRLLAPWDDEFRVPGEFGYGSNTHKVPDELERVRVPFRELYPDITEFLSKWHGMELDDATGRYGYWQNPNAKWDWYVVGGRWERWAEETIGGVYVPVDEIAFDADAAREKAERWWAKNMDDDGKPSNAMAALSWNQLDHNRYVEGASHFSMRAVITPDGEWHEVGDMGWWGISSESAEEMYEWQLHFEERFLKPYRDCTLTVVDCHI